MLEGVLCSLFKVQQITGSLSGIWLVNGGSFLILIGPWGLCLILIGYFMYISRWCRQTGVLQHPSAVFVMDWFWFGSFLSWHRNVTCSRSCRIIAGHKVTLEFTWSQVFTYCCTMSGIIATRDPAVAAVVAAPCCWGWSAWCPGPGPRPAQAGWRSAGQSPSLSLPRPR